MNYFLDMCIIIFYASDTNDVKSIKAIKFVNNKKTDKFLLCYYVTRENMPKWIKRQNIILKIVGTKILNPSFEVEKMEGYEELFSQDIILLKKRLAQYSSSDNKPEYYLKLRKNHDLIIQKINYFITKLIDKEVIEKADPELKSALFTFIQNNSDAITLASAIQYNKEETLTIITGDKKDWNRSNIDWAFNSKPELVKKYPKIPEIKYIQDI
jgi:hypothetical protein